MTTKAMGLLQAKIVVVGGQLKAAKAEVETARVAMATLTTERDNLVKAVAEQTTLNQKLQAEKTACKDRDRAASKELAELKAQHEKEQKQEADSWAAKAKKDKAAKENLAALQKDWDDLESRYETLKLSFEGLQFGEESDSDLE